MAGFRVAYVVMLTACYSPTYTESLPCSETGNCPPGQECDPIAQVCVSENTDAPEYIAVAAGQDFTCAVRKDRSLWCWGDDRHGQLGDGMFVTRGTPMRVAGADNWTALSAGLQTICGLRGEGELWCWGDRFENNDASDPTPVRIGNRSCWRAVDVGYSHACAIDADSHLWCWGHNGSGEVGVGDSQEHLMPVQVDDELWRAVATGDTHSCGIRMDRSIYCWGSDQGGELGNGPTVMNSGTPIIASPGTWDQIDSFDSHTCALDTTGHLACWGFVTSALSLGTAVTPIDGDYTSISVGNDTVAAVRRDGKRVVLGSGSRFQRGDAIHEFAMEFGEPKDPRIWKTVSMGSFHGCGIRQDDTLWCWGSNEFGALGEGTIGRKRTPAQVGTSTNWTAISVSVDHACGIESKDLYCWGDNGLGQLGIGNKIPMRRTTLVAQGRDWIDVSAGWDHTCAIDVDHGMWCWGHNVDGGLGTGGMGGEQTEPRQIGMGRMWTRVAAGYHWSCGIAGSLFCWGKARGSAPREIESSSWLDVSLERQEGGTEAIGVTATGGWQWVADNQMPPANSTQNTPWTELRRNNAHTCGIQSPGTLWCIGRNGRGQVGNNTNTDLNTGFAQIGGDRVWRTASAGYEHSCAIDTEKQLWCWGSNGDGELGIDSQEDAWVPTKLDGNWAAVSTGDAATCGIREDGTLWCWGTNEHDELGDGTGSAPGPQVVR